MTAARVIAELARIGFADIRKVVSWRPEVTIVTEEGEEGKTKQVLVSRITVLDSATLSEDAAAAVAEVIPSRQRLAPGQDARQAGRA